ncbi:MAG: 4Fe-4S binding protein, partial [Bacteroidales bacterium]|nr:4Fe-4S binding protein [Bacteroidales bacterium]
TSIVASLAALAESKVMVDCDVDAADLFLVLKPQILFENKYLGGKTAVIDYSKCTNCGICKDLCRFDAINTVGDRITISEFSCDGCELCKRVCPEDAISMIQSDSSRWFISDSRFGPMVYARLGIAEDNSGKLVTVVREEAKKIAKDKNRDFVIIDGPPGIGCPVIASITGVNIAIIVTEPTQSGLHDLKRVVELVNNFSIKALIILNKFDLNKEMTEVIEKYCKKNDIEIIAWIPFNRIFVDAMVNQQTIVEYNKFSELSNIIQSIWNKIQKYTV